LRHARGAYQGTLVELSAVVPELALLARADFATSRLDQRRHALERAERITGLVERRSAAVPLIAGLLAIQVLWLTGARGSSTWLVVVALLGIATADSLATIRLAIDTAVAVSGSSERLEDLNESSFGTGDGWPVDATIRAEHLTLREDETDVVRDASFAFVPGTRVALVGPSGAGKSTFLRALGGLDPVWSGILSIGAVPVRDINETEFRTMLSYVASEPGFTKGYARDVLFLGRASDRESYRELSDLGIATDEVTRFDELSRGERQRVAIVRALVSNPRVLVADEPTSGLGPEETDKVLELLATIDATIVIATHDERVVRWCDETYELTNGQLRKLTR
jgi:ABC-type bacteriocin/lantibiotic exporter with double-glycine peptidase domain